MVKVRCGCCPARPAGACTVYELAGQTRRPQRRRSFDEADSDCAPVVNYLSAVASRHAIRPKRPTHDVTASVARVSHRTVCHRRAVATVVATADCGEAGVVAAAATATRRASTVLLQSPLPTRPVAAGRRRNGDSKQLLRNRPRRRRSSGSRPPSPPPRSTPNPPLAETNYMSNSSHFFTPGSYFQS
jgi:hypothetical protein